jgi:hypothetical protein
VFVSTLGLAIAVAQIDVRLHSGPVRALALRYQKSQHRVFGVRLDISAAAHKRPAAAGGGYELVVRYTFDYAGRRWPFVVYPPSFDEYDGHAARLFFFQPDDKTGAAIETRYESGRQVEPPFVRDGQKPFLIGTPDRPANGQLRLLCLHDQVVGFEAGDRMVSAAYQPGRRVYVQLNYTPVQRGSHTDAWVGGALYSNVAAVDFPR